MMVDYKTVLISDLKPDPKNARKHGEKNLSAIKASLERFGQQGAIIATRDGTVVAGNGTMAAAKALGWESLNVAYTDLKGKELKAFAIAHNKSATLAEWDDAVLEDTLLELKEANFDIATIGFDDWFEKKEPKEKAEKKQKECPSCGHLL